MNIEKGHYDPSEIIFVQSDNAELAVQHFGKSDNTPLILIMGATASMDWWDKDFCTLLADSGFYVIRYDNRDVGQSTCCPPGEFNYDVSDMVNDLFAVADHFKLDKFNVMGMSLGGMIAQIAAIRKPSRIQTLILLATSVWDDLPHLPVMTDEVIAFHQKMNQIDWTDKQQIIQYSAEGWKILAGSKYGFDEQRALRNARLEYERANNFQSRFNHGVLAGHEELYGQSKNITAPALIIHGSEDPIFALEHGYELHKVIHGSTLCVLEGVGHELPAEEWTNVAELVTHHIKKSL